jgi:hypothetical protein
MAKKIKTTLPSTKDMVGKTVKIESFDISKGELTAKGLATGNMYLFRGIEFFSASLPTKPKKKK